ncbi:hypothetical protein BJX99DRAFT_237003 [Aspergillus californicus]
MQSQLTRRVFQAIINNEPLPCRNRFLHAARPYQCRRVAPGPSYVQRRGLFAFNKPSGASLSTALPSEIGLQPMRELERSITQRHREPGFDVLAKALQDFFHARAEDPGVINSFQARLLLMTWKHLREHEQDMEPEDWQRVFSVENLENMLLVISDAECLPGARTMLCKVARYVFADLRKVYGDGGDQFKTSLQALIKIQALNGNPSEAQALIENLWRKADPSTWLVVVKGFAMADNKHQVERIIGKFDQLGVIFDSASQEEYIQYLIGEGLQTAVKPIYNCPLPKGQKPSLSTKIAVSRYAILNSDIAWAEPIITFIRSNPVSKTIGIRLLWDAARGKDASQIADIVELWTANDPEIMASLSISDVNDLIAYANSTNNPTLASAFTALAPAWGLEPDIQTKMLNLEARIQACDVDGALESFEDIEDMDKAAPENRPIMNKLVSMLCLSGQDDATFEQISSFLDPLFENNVRLESDTLAALTHMLVYRHDWAGLSTLLRPRLGSYDDEGKAKVRGVLIKFILDLAQDTDQAWEAYGLLQLAFPETGVPVRTKIMTSFFKRNRSDLAFMVFGRMRQAEHFAQRPKIDTYTRCFQGFVETRDLKHLELVHNMLKLDTEFDLNTRLLNWLMLAYAECEMPEKGMEIFRDILQSEEGPSPRTVLFFFKVCTKHHNGVQEAMRMMSKLKLLEIEVDRHLYMGYVEALAAQCDFDLATEALESLKEVTGYPPTFRSIGQFYNAIPYQYWKDEVELWAKEKYPDLWAELDKLERTEHEEGMQFQLQRINDEALDHLDATL